MTDVGIAEHVLMAVEGLIAEPDIIDRLRLIFHIIRRGQNAFNKAFARFFASKMLLGFGLTVFTVCIRCRKQDAAADQLALAAIVHDIEIVMQHQIGSVVVRRCGAVRDNRRMVGCVALCSRLDLDDLAVVVAGRLIIAGLKAARHKSCRI